MKLILSPDLGKNSSPTHDQYLQHGSSVRRSGRCGETFSSVQQNSTFGSCNKLLPVVMDAGVLVVVTGARVSCSRGTIEKKRDPLRMAATCFRKRRRSAVPLQSLSLLLNKSRKFSLLIGKPLSPARENDCSDCARYMSKLTLHALGPETNQPINQSTNKPKRSKTSNGS